MRPGAPGPSGRGEGAQGVLLSERYGIPQISTGEVLRDHVQRGTKLGISARSYMDRGDYVPDDLMISMVMERLAEADAQEGFILDGFPRTVPQAEALERALDRSERPLTPVLKYSIGGDLAVRRLLGRMTCSSCGRTYHLRRLRHSRGASESDPLRVPVLREHRGFVRGGVHRSKG